MTVLTGKFSKPALSAEQIVQLLNSNEFYTVSILAASNMETYVMRANTAPSGEEPKWINQGTKQTAESMLVTMKNHYWATAIRIVAHLRSQNWESTRITALMDKIAADYANTPESERYAKFSIYAGNSKPIKTVEDIINRYRTIPASPMAKSKPANASKPANVQTPANAESGNIPYSFIIQINGQNARYEYAETAKNGSLQYRVQTEARDIVRDKIKAIGDLGELQINGESFVVKEVKRRGLWLYIAPTNPNVTVVSQTETRKAIHTAIQPMPEEPVQQVNPNAKVVAEALGIDISTLVTLKTVLGKIDIQ